MSLCVYIAQLDRPRTRLFTPDTARVRARSVMALKRWSCLSISASNPWMARSASGFLLVFLWRPISIWTRWCDRSSLVRAQKPAQGQCEWLHEGLWGGWSLRARGPQYSVPKHFFDTWRKATHRWHCLFVVLMHVSRSRAKKDQHMTFYSWWAFKLQVECHDHTIQDLAGDYDTLQDLLLGNHKEAVTCYGSYTQVPFDIGCICYFAGSLVPCFKCVCVCVTSQDIMTECRTRTCGWRMGVQMPHWRHHWYLSLGLWRPSRVTSGQGKVSEKYFLNVIEKSVNFVRSQWKVIWL